MAKWWTLVAVCVATFDKLGGVGEELKNATDPINIANIYDKSPPACGTREKKCDKTTFSI